MRHTDCDDWNEEPVGSCCQCGANLYDGDDLEEKLCSQCSWYAWQGRDDE